MDAPLCRRCTELSEVDPEYLFCRGLEDPPPAVLFLRYNDDGLEPVCLPCRRDVFVDCGPQLEVSLLDGIDLWTCQEVLEA